MRLVSIPIYIVLAISSVLKSASKYFAFISCFLLLPLFLITKNTYEAEFDAQWHENWIERLIRWNDISLDLGGSILHNFGIQLPVNPLLSPALMLASYFPQDVRVPVAAFLQAAVMYFICAILGRAAIPGRGATPVALVATAFCWIPTLSDTILSTGPISGLLWQDSAIATLLAFYFFNGIGRPSTKGRPVILPAAYTLFITFWTIFAYPELLPFIAPAFAFLCAGSLFGSIDRSEVVAKLLVSAITLAGVLVVRLDLFLIYLFAYTPQSYYGTRYTMDYSFFMGTTSMLLRAFAVGSVSTVLIFGMVVVGGVRLIRQGTDVGRKIVFAVLTLEVAVHTLGVFNLITHKIPLSLFYIEIVAVPVLALVAAEGVVWVMEIVLALFLAMSQKFAPRAFGTAVTVGDLIRCVLLVGILGLIADFFPMRHAVGAWPPKADSQPVRIMASELAVNPGGVFRGRSVVIADTGEPNPISWTRRFYFVTFYKYKPQFGNDLMNDVAVFDIPNVHEYGHWVSPPMLALFAAAFYNPKDPIDRVAQTPREFRPNLARALGVSLVVSDRPLSEGDLLYHGIAVDHPVFVYRIKGANIGDYSPSRTVRAQNARAILDVLQAPNFDARKVAVLEDNNETDLSLAKKCKNNLRERSTDQGASVLCRNFFARASDRL
jgi:hypothetical protein